MNVHRVFPPAELERVRAAARAAEERTGGEIVAYVVGRSDAYEGGAARAALGGAIFAALAAGLAHSAFGVWGGFGPVWITLPVLAGTLLGWALAAFVPRLAALLTREEAVERRVAGRAAAAFLEEEVFATRDRTGILLFLSLLEHRVVVLADSGIKAKVSNQEWEGIASDLAAGMRRGRAADALIEAIDRSGRLLEAAGIARRSDDVDELPDALRLRDE